MKEKFLELQEKTIKFYEEHRDIVIKTSMCVFCIFLGYLKGKSDALNKMSDINFNIRVNDAREKLPSRSN